MVMISDLYRIDPEEQNFDFQDQANQGSPFPATSAFTTLGQSAPSASPTPAPQSSRPSFGQMFSAVMAGQNPYDVHSQIQARKANQDRQDAQTEMQYFEALINTPPQYRDPIVKSAARWYEARGTKIQPEFLDFWKKASADELEATTAFIQDMYKDLSPEEQKAKVKQLMSTNAGVMEFFSKTASIRNTLAQAAQREAEAEFTKQKPAILKEAFSGSEAPESSTSPSIPQSSVPTSPQSGVAPRPSQSPQTPSLRRTSQPEILRTPEGQRIQQFVVAKAKELGLDPAYAQALVHQESGWNEQAVSPTGVEGLNQVTVETGKPYGQTAQNRKNPYVSANAGLTYLSKLVRANGGDMQKALAQYNGGSDPNFVQNVERHVPLYKGTAGPPSQGMQAMGSDVIAQRQKLESAISRLQETHTKLTRHAGDKDIDRAADNVKNQIDFLQKNLERLEKRAEPKSGDWHSQAASEMGLSTSINERSPEQNMIVNERAAQLEAQSKATSAEATLPYELKKSQAQNAGRFVEDETEYVDEKGNQAPSGVTREELRAGNYKRVKKLPDAMFTDAQQRRDLVRLMSELDADHSAISKGPVAGRLERWKMALGQEVGDETAAQRLVLSKITNDMAFQRGGKALTASEIKRISEELPKDIEASSVFNSKLKKALKVARQIAQDHVKDFKGGGYRVPPSLEIEGEGSGTVSPALEEALKILKGGQ